MKLSPSTSKWGWKIQLDDSIGLHVKDIAILYQIKYFFGDIGSISYHEEEEKAVYSVRSLKDVLHYIIPHLDKDPLHSKKRADDLLFKSVAFLLKEKKHLSLQGLQQVINIRASMNRGLTSSLKWSFPETTPQMRPDV